MKISIGINKSGKWILLITLFYFHFMSTSILLSTNNSKEILEQKMLKELSYIHLQSNYWIRTLNFRCCSHKVKQECNLITSNPTIHHFNEYCTLMVTTITYETKPIGNIGISVLNRDSRMMS